MKLNSIILALALSATGNSAMADSATTLTGLPGSVNYGNSFSVLSGQATSSTVTPLLNSTFNVTDYFYDDYTFTIPVGTLSSVTSSITLGSSAGLTNLQARLYTGSAHLTGSAPVVSGAGWGTVATTPILPGVIDVTTVVLNPTSVLAAGTYTLQIRGKVSGALSGAYSGVLNVTAVPEPSTYGMLLSGMALVGFMARRRKV